MTAREIKKFYKDVSIGAGETGHAILLDGRVVRTPLRRALDVRSRVLAEAIAAEWRGQGESVRPDGMALTKLANTALDRVAERRDEVIAQCLKFAEGDVLCYRAETPADLARRQSEAWDPLLAWLEERFDALLKVTTGIGFITQPEAALAALKRGLSAYDDFALAAIAAAAASSGSLVLALALAEGRLDAGRAFAASRLEETYQAERWGEDAEAAARAAMLRDDLEAAGRFLALISGQS